MHAVWGIDTLIGEPESKHTDMPHAVHKQHSIAKHQVSTATF